MRIYHLVKKGRGERPELLATAIQAGRREHFGTQREGGRDKQPFFTGAGDCPLPKSLKAGSPWGEASKCQPVAKLVGLEFHLFLSALTNPEFIYLLLPFIYHSSF